MGRLFGTDGARGVAITELTVERATQIGKAAALVLAKDCGHRPKIIIGKDTRISGDILEAALCAGICSVGADAVLLGVVPTPAVAMLVKKYNADAGVMISASHNSVEFNGIKLFSGEGFKLPDDVENEIEALILDTPEEMEKNLSEGVNVGRMKVCGDAVNDYIAHVKSTVDVDFKGIKVCLDCANGSSSVCAQKIFEGLGAEVVMTNDKPDGTNINEKCGSTHMEGLKKAVVENGCDVGLAFDGDADRCLAVDENGELIDGDKLLAIFSKFMKGEGTLKNDCCVVTVMSNLGFFKFAEKEGEIREINEEDPTYDSCGRTYEILVHAEHRIYSSVPEETVREITSASGVEDGWYGFSADDMEEALLNTVQSLWYGMDPRGGGEGEEIEAFGGHISEEMERILLNGLNEDASGFFVDSDDPPEDD